MDVSTPRKKPRKSSSAFLLEKCDFEKGNNGINLEAYPIGSILRIKLVNFVTFSQCTLNPGPSLNMIIGPNGSGKSTLIAALAIGLGWPPSVLGRSRDIREYIKHEQLFSIIEIIIHTPNTMEFKKLLGKTANNKEWTVFRRKFNQNGVSEWHINDIPALLKNINAITFFLKIQVDNLCQFLPQDRVIEFARLSPKELFIETQRAAAPVDSLEKQQKLADLYKEKNLMSEKLDRQEHELEALKEKNQSMKETILRIREYWKHLQNVEFAKMKRPFVELAKIKKDKKQTIKQKDDLEKLIQKKIKTDIYPIENELEEIKQEIEKINTSTTCTKIKKLSEKLRTTQSEIDSNEVDSQQVRNDALINWKGVQRKIKVLQETNSVIQRTEREMATMDSTPFDRKYRKQELDSLEKSMANMQASMNELSSEQKRIQNEGLMIGRKVDSISSQLKQFNEIKNAKLTYLNQREQQTARAHQFISENRSKFPTVLGPVLLEINVKDLWATRLLGNSFF